MKLSLPKSQEHCGTGHGALRRVVLHADDFGMNPAVTDGILDGFQQGLLTGTSVLSNAPDAARALAAWKQLAEDRRRGCLPSARRRQRLEDPERAFDLGVHLNLTQGRPLSGDRFPADLLDPEGRLRGIGLLARRLARSGRRFARAIEEELGRQIEFVLDHGHRPSHLSGHQYVELIPTVGRIVASLLARFQIGAVRVAVESAWLRSLGWPGVGLGRWLVGAGRWCAAGQFRRRVAAAGVVSPDAFLGSLSAGRVTLQQIRSFLAANRRFRRAEIVLHPARATDDGAAGDGWSDPWAARRAQELQLVLSNELAVCLEQAGVGLGRMT